MFLPYVLFAGCDLMGGTCGSGFVSTADDVQEMSVVCGVRGIGGVCEVCMARGKGSVSVFGMWWCWGEWVAWSSVWEGGVMSMCVVSLDSLRRCQVQVSVYCARQIPAHI